MRSWPVRARPTIAAQIRGIGAAIVVPGICRYVPLALQAVTVSAGAVQDASCDLAAPELGLGLAVEIGSGAVPLMIRDLPEPVRRWLRGASDKMHQFAGAIPGR